MLFRSQGSNWEDSDFHKTDLAEVIFEFEGNCSASAYALVQADDKDEAPVSWRLSVSSDGEHWNLLDEIKEMRGIASNLTATVELDGTKIVVAG